MDQSSDFLANIPVTILAALFVFVVGYLATRLIIRSLKAMITKFISPRDYLYSPLLIQFIIYIINGILLLLVIVATLSTLGFNTGLLVTVVAAAGIAVTLALQDSLKNFASGVLLVAFRPFEKGDSIEVGMVKGTVDEVQLFTTIINTPDNVRVIVPNATINNDVIINKSSNEKRRIDLIFRVSYDTDIRRVKEIIEPILKQDAYVLADPVPEIAIDELAPSSINFYVRPWVKSDDYGSAKSGLIEKIKIAFDEYGITIPYPQQYVYLRSEDALRSSNARDV